MGPVNAQDGMIDRTQTSEMTREEIARIINYRGRWRASEQYGVISDTMCHGFRGKIIEHFREGVLGSYVELIYDKSSTLRVFAAAGDFYNYCDENGIKVTECFNGFNLNDINRLKSAISRIEAQLK